MNAVYCNRCGSLIRVSSGDDAFRVSQDHEMDEHPDGWGLTVYERIAYADV